MTGVVEGKILPPAVDPRVNMDDPPIFLLQASATWAPWLNDGMYQRVPVGSAGQVLTVNADGSVGWSNSSAGFTNPMSTTGDLISSNPGSTPVAIHIGTSGQVLTVVSGVPAWAADVGFANPMTTVQDLIVGGTAGAAGRLGVGANGQVLTVTSGAVGWANSAAGFANPMTTLGDIITAASGGAAQRLGVGAANQVLTVVSGAPAWANSAAGFANPMTASGDMIVGGLSGTATRLPAGANGQVLTLVSGSPAWTAGATGASAVVFPSGSTVGNTDRINIMNADAGLASGGEILLAAGAFYVKPASGNNCLTPRVQTVVAPQGSSIAGSPVCLRGLGPATIIYPVGTGVTGIYYHRTTSYGAQFGLPAQPTTGYLRDFVIDGSLATGASTGLDIGDGWGYDVNLRIVNFTGTGATGFVLAQDVFWCEKGDYRCELINNTTAALLTTRKASTDHSNEYNRYWFTIFVQQGQNGVIVDGTNQGGCELWLRGNMYQTTAASGAPTGNVAALTIRNTTASPESRWYAGGIHMKVEANPSPLTLVPPYALYSDGNGYIRHCDVRIVDSALTASNWNGAEFTARGVIADSVLAQLVTGPANSSSTYANRAATTATSGNLITFTDGAASYANGTAVFWLMATGGFSAGVAYYVIGASSNTCQLSTTPGGGAFTVTSNASGTLDPAGPPMPATGVIQQNYGPDAMVYITGGTGVTLATQGSPVPYSPSVQNPYFIPAGGAITVNYTTAPTWNWAPCSQSQY